MATDLFTPVLNDRTRSVRFFNGRLLSGEAMTDEQSGLRAARELLAQAVGDGVAQGFEVKEAVGASATLAPVLAIGAGVAINRRGEILLLANDTQVKLVRPAHPSTAPASLFQTCTPPAQGVYVADSGVYLLTICSLGAANGLAEVSGLGGIQASCNAKYVVDAVQFRLLELPVDKTILSDPRLRNLVAYQCFGAGHASDFATDPFGAAGEPHTLLDDVRASKLLTDCDVPLALMYWTATGGVQFLDMWSVRRRVTRAPSPLAALEDARLAVAEAMVSQFQEQLAALATNPASTALAATTVFRHLPPFGMVPVGSTPGRDFSLLTFFASLKTRGPFYIEGSRAASVVRQALQFFPIDVASPELIWLYRIRENQQAIDDLTGATPRAALLFVTGQASWRGDAHLDVSKWNYANYA